MKSKLLIHTISLLAIATCFFGCAEQKEGETKPLNVLYIMADDLAYQAISAYGSPISKLAPTPNLDRIAASGARMDAVYCTNSICGPSRSSILTGKFSHLNGFYKNVDGGDFDGSQMTFPKIFQANGYETAVIGKWHLGTEPTGFDYSKVLINWGGQGTYFNPQFCINGQDTVVERTRHSTQVIEDDCIDWLTQRDSEKPFMLLYQFKAPHRDWRPDSMYHDLFTDFDFPLPENFNDDYAGRPAAAENMMEIENHLNRRDMKQEAPLGLSRRDSMRWLAYGDKGQFWTPHDSLQGEALKYWKYQTYIKDYLRCVAGVDRAIGRVLDYLEETGLDENTLVVYTSDQGFYLGEHGWFDKRWMYEESLHTPLIVRWPGQIHPDTTNTDLVSNLDFAQTFLDIAGTKQPGDMQGLALTPLLRGKTPANWRKTHYYHYYEAGGHGVPVHYGVTDGRHKLIRFPDVTLDAWEFFDLKKDPNEMQSRYDDPQYTRTIAALKEELNRLRKQYQVENFENP